METKLIATIIIALVIGTIIGFFIGQSTTGQYGRWIAGMQIGGGAVGDCPPGQRGECSGPAECSGWGATECKLLPNCKWECK